MGIAHQLVVIFCEIDESCKELNKYVHGRCLPGQSKTHRGPICSLTINKIMTILIMFQMVRFQDFKTFYEGFLLRYWRPYFTYYRKNMKNKLELNDFEKQLLNQRNLIETVIDHLKYHYQVWHTLHRLGDQCYDSFGLCLSCLCD